MYGVYVCLTMCVWCVCIYKYVWLCVYDLYVCDCVCTCVCTRVCVTCLTSAETVVQVMEAFCSTTKQIVFLQIPWPLWEFQARITISTMEYEFIRSKYCKADIVLNQTLIWVSIYHKFLRKIFEIILYAQNTLVGVSCRREEVILVLNQWKYNIMSFFSRCF